MKLFRFLANLFCRATSHFVTRYHKSSLATFGRGGSIGPGFQTNCPHYVHLGEGVVINDHCWVSFDEAAHRNKLVRDKPRVYVGDRSYIGRFATIACVEEVLIGKDVLIADRVFIGDCYHGFSRTDIPIKDQNVYPAGKVTIEDGAWIGIGAAILPNVRVGKNAVIGANSVVRCDVPDYHVAAGVPAKIIRNLRD